MKAVFWKLLLSSGERVVLERPFLKDPTELGAPHPRVETDPVSETYAFRICYDGRIP